MGLIPIVAWTFFFLLLTIMLCYNTLKAAKMKMTGLFQSLISQAPLQSWNEIDELVSEKFKALKMGSFQSESALIDLGSALSNERVQRTLSRPMQSMMIDYLKEVRSYQAAAKSFKHLLEHQPTKLVAQFLRWK
jgi:hypothetical protein